MECLPSVQSRAVHSMVNRRGAGPAWSGISDLRWRSQARETPRDHGAGLAEGPGVERYADGGDLAVANVAPVGHQQRLGGDRGVQLEPGRDVVAVHEHAA